jgi:hypothetical protein
MTDKQILLKFIRFFMSRNTPSDPPGAIRWTRDLYKFDEKIFGGVPSAFEFSAPAAPQLSGPPATKTQLRPCAHLYILKNFPGLYPGPLFTAGGGNEEGDS